MSVVTLETLRADFEEARQSYYDVWGPVAQQSLMCKLIDWSDIDATLNEIESLTKEHGLWIIHESAGKVIASAKLYVIARDEGLNAAMLWKLTYGGVL